MERAAATPPFQNFQMGTSSLQQFRFDEPNFLLGHPWPRKF
jgi:hypothetical protein